MLGGISISEKVREHAKELLRHGWTRINTDEHN
jgi:hypothetical protein